MSIGMGEWERRLGPVPESTVVLCSGGVASTVLAHWAARADVRLIMLSCDLGGQVRRIEAAATTAARVRADHQIVNLADFARAVTTGRAPSAMPNARAVMVELAIALAMSRRATVLLGLHADDLLDDIPLGDRTKAPFAELSIAEVIQLGVAIQVPLARTHDCRYDHAVHCGQCTGCRHRRGAFVAARVLDPTSYLTHGTGG